MFPAFPFRRRRGPSYEDEIEPRRPALITPLPEARPIVRPPTPEPIATSAPLPSPPVDLGTPPLITEDRRGRPRVMPGVSESDRLPAEQQLFERLQSYEPRKRSILRQIGMGALRGLAAGGPGGAVGGAVFGAGTALLDPLAEDRAWQEKEMARSLGRQQIYRGQQRADLGDELLRAQVEETQAQAEQRRNPRPKLVEAVMPDGTAVLVPETPGVITGRPKPDQQTYTVNVPGVGPIQTTAAPALGYYGQVERRGEERGIREGERMSNFERARISLSEAEAAERENLTQRQVLSQQVSQLRAARSALKPDPALVTFNGQINDPNYWAQADALDAQIKDAETEVTRRQRLADEAGNEARRLRGEVGRYGARPTTTTPPPPPGVTEASIRAEARRRGANEDEAVQRARQFKWIP